MLPVLMQARSSCFPVPGSKQQRETKSRRQVVTTSSALRLIKSQRQAMRRHFIFIYHTCETVYIVLSYDTSFLLLLSSTRSQHLCLQRRPRTTGSPRRTLSPQLPAHASVVLSYDTSFLLLLSSTRSQHLCLQRRPRTTGSPRRTLSPQLPAHASVLSCPRK